ncbi:MAG: hypothetical protein U0V73_16575 [Acidimicrobiia bacterium]
MLGDSPDALRERLEAIEAQFGPVSDTAGAATRTESNLRTVTWALVSRPIDVDVDLEPAAADALVRASPCMAALERAIPSVVRGPLDRERQYWISSGTPSRVLPGDAVPREQAFVSSIAEARWPRPLGQGAKTGFERLGLHTSTGWPGSTGMWRSYMGDMQGLHQRPWYTWHVLPNQSARVLEIDGAQKWIEVVRRYPRESAGALNPDWWQIRDDYDIVHVTLSAAVATQGLRFRLDGYRAGTVHWDVETAWWLNWCVERTELVNVDE